VSKKSLMRNNAPLVHPADSKKAASNVPESFPKFALKEKAMSRDGARNAGRVFKVLGKDGMVDNALHGGKCR
jgi:hypothetical protein